MHLFATNILLLIYFLCCTTLKVSRSNIRQFKSHFKHNTCEIRALVDCPSGGFDDIVIKESYKIPVVVDFFANWCGPCKLVAPIFKQVAENTTVYPDNEIKFVKVDTDINEEMVEKFSIQGLPLFGLFFQGKIIRSHSGALNKQNLYEFIGAGLNDINSMSATKKS